LSTARRLVAQAIGATGVNIWLAALSLFTTPYVLLHLGTATYGVFAMISLAAAYLSNLEFGFGYASVRYLARARAEGSREREQAVFGTSLAVFLAAGLAGGLLLTAAAPFLVQRFFLIPLAIQGPALAAFRSASLILFASFLTTFFFSVLQAVGRFDWLNGARAAAGTLSAAATVSVIAAGGGLREVVWAQAVVNVASAVVLAAAVSRVSGQSLLPRARWPMLKEMAAFSVIVFLGGLAYQWMINGPAVVLGARLPSAELPPFTVPQTVVQRLSVVMTSASLAFFPFASAASVDPDRARLFAVFRSHLRLSIIVVGAATAYLVVFADVLLAAWISPEFAHAAAPCLRILSLAALVLSLSSAPADVARALGHPRWVLVYTTLVAVSGVGLSLKLVSAHGAAGVSLAFLSSLLLGTVPLLFAVGARLLGQGILCIATALARPLLAVLAAGAAYALVAPYTRGLAGALLAGVGMTAVYVVVVFTWVLDPRERAAFGMA
jgi:O-antigen/teichoic acid export membrane protein